MLHSFAKPDMDRISEEPAMSIQGELNRMRLQDRVGSSFEKYGWMVRFPANGRKRRFLLFDLEHRIEPVTVDVQDDAKDRCLQVVVLAEPDGPVGVFACVELDDLNNCRDQVFDIIIHQPGWNSLVEELIGFDTEVIDTGVLYGKAQFEDDGSSYAFDKPEQAEIRPGMKIGA